MERRAGIRSFVFYRFSVRLNIRDELFVVEINLLIVLFLLLALVFGYLKEYLLSFFCIALHEGGHIISANLMGIRVYGIKLLPLGINAFMDETTCVWKEKVAVLLSGPFVNIVLFIGGWLLVKYSNSTTNDLDFFILMNASLAVFNLFPIIPLDGGRVLKELISEKAGAFYAESCIRKISIIISLLMILVGIIQIIFKPRNISLLSIGIYILMIIITEKPEAAIMNIKHIVFRRERFLKKGIYPAREIVAVKSAPLIEALKSMDFDRFHFVYVVDNDMRLIKVFTEQEIIDGMLEHNSHMTFEELIKVYEKKTPYI
jgi:stage IV sporulation protein FB